MLPQEVGVLLPRVHEDAEGGFIVSGRIPGLEAEVIFLIGQETTDRSLLVEGIDGTEIALELFLGCLSSPIDTSQQHPPTIFPEKKIIPKGMDSPVDFVLFITRHVIAQKLQVVTDLLQEIFFHKISPFGLGGRGIKMVARGPVVMRTVTLLAMGG
jgi:hypothetical protein